MAYIATAEAEVAPEVEPTGLQRVVALAFGECVRGGLLPSEAAVRIVGCTKIDVETLTTLATMGLAHVVADKLHKARERSAVPHDENGHARNGHVETARLSRERTTERRATLYNRVKGALDALYAGADGRMRTLREFSLADHRFRLAEVEAIGAGYLKSAKFHKQALSALKAARVETIGALPSKSQAQLSSLLS